VTAKPSGTGGFRPAPPDDRQRRSGEERVRGGLTTRRGVLGGIAAGLIGIGCCAGPTVAALLGVISASTAVSLAGNLYGHWEWAFLLAGTLAAAAVVVTARRRARSCAVAPGRQRRFLVLVAFSALATYGILYAVTTALGRLAS